MLESLFLALVGLAITMSVLTAYDREEIAWPIMGFITWIVLSASAHSIGVPTAHLLSDDTILAVSTQYSGGSYTIVLLAGFAVVFVAITINRIMTMYRASTKKTTKEAT